MRLIGVPALTGLLLLLLHVLLGSGGTSAAVVVLATNETYIDRVASFGPRLGEPPGVIGQLVVVSLVDPSNQLGCKALPREVVPSPFSGPWIALVERGECSFVEKVRNMQASTAAGVVVGDNDSNLLLTMYSNGDTSDITIPSVFVAQAQYRELRFLASIMNNGSRQRLDRMPLMVMLIKDESIQSMLYVVITTVATPLVLLFFVYALYRLRSRILGPRPSDLAPLTYVSSLPTKSFYATKRRRREPVDCVICLEDFADEDELRILPCGHEFHVSCIDPWLTMQRKCCPVCKADVFPDEATPLLGPRAHSPNGLPAGPGVQSSPHSRLQPPESFQSPSFRDSAAATAARTGGDSPAVVPALVATADAEFVPPRDA